MDWKSFFDRLGMNGTRWQWRMVRYERDFKALLRGEQISSLPSPSQILIGLNVTLFALMVLHGVSLGVGLQGLLRPPTQLLLAWGGQLWPLVLNYDQWWRCLTYAYTHGGIIHLGFNMMVLYQVGPLLENELGGVRFFVLYTLTALTATLADLVWHPGVPVVGASGSLFGLIGFAAVYYHRMGPAGEGIRNFMLKWALFAFVFGLLVGADNAAHLGGALGGAVFGLLLPLGARGRRASARLFNLLGIGCLLATLAALGWMLSSLIFSH